MLIFQLWNEWIAEGNVFRFTNLENLLEPVTSYLESTRAQRNNLNQTHLYTCFFKTPLLDVIENLLVNHIHQLFVVDENAPNKLLSVVSYTDIFNYLFS